MTRAAVGTALAGGLGVAALVLAGTSAAGAASSGVTVRAGINDPKDPTVAVLQYLPGTITVKTGATVNFSWKGTIEPHSVTFLAPGQKLPAPGSDPGLFGATPPTGPYDGTQFVNSGLQPLGPATPPKFAVTFAKAGKFNFYCVIHPQMVGAVKVVDRGKTDSAKQVTKRGAAEQRKWVAEGEAAKKKLVKHANISTKSSDGSRTWVIQMGTSTKHTDVLAFAPTPRKIKAGDSIQFVNNSSAPHTGTFVGRQPPITNPVGPQTDDPSPGPSPQTLNSTGLFNTGLLPPNAPDSPGGSPPPRAARSYTYKVPAKGKYPFYCILHTLSGMGGVVRAS